MSEKLPFAGLIFLTHITLKNMKFTAEDIERNFRGAAGIRAYSKKPEHAGDAGY